MALTHVARQPEGRRPFGEGQAPKPDYVWEHCLREARRELDCLSNCLPYQWRPYEPQLEPLDFFEFVR